MALAPIEEEEEVVEETAWPARHELAAQWDELWEVRAQMRQHGKLLQWPVVEQTGLPALQALSRNRECIRVAIQVWGATVSSKAKSPPLKWLKEEAGCHA